MTWALQWLLDRPAKPTCSTGGPSHYYRNTAAPGEPPAWACRCGATPNQVAGVLAKGGRAGVRF